MRVHICAVGRMRSGPERDLMTDYLDRFARTGRPLALGPAQVHEVEDKRGGGMAAEASLLARTIPQAALMVAMDERGADHTSPEFAALLARWRDAGHQDLAFVIGGADGIDSALRAQAGHAISLGRMVWPHMLVRVMLAEQLYRASTILSGGPYHRS